MKTSEFRFGFLLALVVLALGAVALPASPAHAQNSTTKMAVLDVPGGGSQLLVDAIGQIDDLEIKRQGWFLEQITSRGFQPKGIMKRPEDVKWVMKGADLDYILYLAAKDDTSYQGRLVARTSGETEFQFPVDRTPDGLSAAGARSVYREVAGYLEKQRAAAQQQAQKAQKQAQQPQVATVDDPNEVKRQATEQKSAAQQKLSKNWLVASLRGNLLRRDLHVSGLNEAVLSYTSVYYPGVAVSFDAFPFGQSNLEYASVGIYADYTQGFDSVPVQTVDGEKTISVGHLMLEGGLMYQLGDAVALKDSNEAKVNLTLGVRYANYSADANDSLPSVGHTSIVIGGQVRRPMFSENFELLIDANIIPYGFYGTGAELFGETSYTYGFGAELGGMYHATDDLGLVFGYGLDVQRTLFEGEGEAEFVDAGAFELVQGLTAGLFYEY